MKRSISRRQFLRISAGASFGMALAGCTAAQAPSTEGSGNAAGQPGCETVEIRATHAWPADQWPRQVEFDENFNAEHPCIQVVGENYSWGDTVTKLTTLAAAGTLPDVIYVHYSWAQRFIADGMVENVQPFLDADPDFWDVDDFVPAALTSYQWQGDQWLIPYNEGPTNLIYYNKRIFDDAGMPYPHSDGDWDLDRMWEVAQALTSGEGTEKVWGYNGLPAAWSLNADILKTWDAQHWNEPCETETSINSDEAIAAMSWWNEFFQSGVTPAPGDIENMPGNPFATGQVAMIKGASWDNRWIKPNLSDPYDVAHAPVGPNGARSSSTAGSAYGMTNDTEHPDEAWEYLRAYNTTEGQIFLFSSIGIDPARWSAWPAYFESDATPPNSEVVMEVMQEYGEHNLLDGPNANEANRTTQSVLDLLWLGEMSPAEVCQEIYAQVSPILAQNQEWCDASHST